MKKTIFATIIIACVAVFAVGNIAYSYFGANMNIVNNLHVGAIFTGDYTPVFTAVSDGNLELTVTDADMLYADAASNNVAVSATGNINVTLDAVGDSKNSIATCNFQFVFEDLSSTDASNYQIYNPSNNLGNSKEYTIEIREKDGQTILEETSINKLKNNEPQIDSHSLTISSSANSATTKTYVVTARIYNLNIDQNNIKNKKFGFRINTTNVTCETDWSE